MTKTLVTEKNISSVFNKVIYPKLDASKEYKDASRVINDILDEYTFSTEEIKVKFLIFCLSVISDKLLRSMGTKLDDLDYNLKTQIGWNFVNLFFNNGQFNPMKLINYADLLNPKAEALFTNLDTVDLESSEWLKNEANTILEFSKDGSIEINKDAIDHIKNIADGNLPFGLKLETK